LGSAFIALHNFNFDDVTSSSHAAVCILKEILERFQIVASTYF